MNEQVKDENGLVIDASNFRNYFFDVRQNKPQAGQVLAKFSAVAVFGDGPEKRDLIKVLKTDKARQAAMVMRKIHCAREPDCYRVCREMCEDMASGMTDEEVSQKEHEFVLEAFYYTKREYVPKNDKHWELINTVMYDQQTNTFKATINMESPVKKEDCEPK